jgi:hypothetical protein
MNQEHWQPDWEIKAKLTPFRHGQKPGELDPRNVWGIRIWLRHGADRREVLIAVRKGFNNLRNAVRFGGLPDEITDRLCYHHLVICLEFDIDFQDERHGPLILNMFREVGKLYHVPAAL